MITKWEDLPGVEKVYYGSFDTIVLIFEDGSFAGIVTKQYYEGDAGLPALAAADDEDALYDAVQAGASGAQELLDAAKAKFKHNLEEQERKRLAYLQKKYGGVK